MLPKKKEIAILYIQNNENNWKYVTSQTQNIRDNTNDKIRQLGNKYYAIKSLFERFNLRRDDIFNFAKILEEEFKNTKDGIHIQNQKKRMKDAIYCWYAEHFYTEICVENTLILKRLIDYCHKPQTKSIPKSRSSIKIKQINKKQEKNKTRQNNNTKEVPDGLLFDQMIFNQEIDSFLPSNISLNNANVDKSQIENPNFNFEKLLNL